MACCAVADLVSGAGIAVRCAANLHWLSLLVSLGILEHNFN